MKGLEEVSNHDRNRSETARYYAPIRASQVVLEVRRHKRYGFNPWVRKIPWRRAWQLTPVFLPGESHGQRDLAGNSPRCHKESDMTEGTWQACMLQSIEMSHIGLPTNGIRKSLSKSKLFIRRGAF